MINDGGLGQAGSHTDVEKLVSYWCISKTESCQ